LFKVGFFSSNITNPFVMGYTEFLHKSTAACNLVNIHTIQRECQQYKPFLFTCKHINILFQLKCVLCYQSLAYRAIHIYSLLLYIVSCYGAEQTSASARTRSHLPAQRLVPRPPSSLTWSNAEGVLRKM